MALNLQVGLDVELASRATRHKDVTKIAQRKFSHKELKQLEGQYNFTSLRHIDV